MPHRFRPSLVVTDLDGTLWNSERQVATETHQAIESLRKAGVPLVAATARNVRSAAMGLEAHRLSMPCVLLNGALVQDPVTNERFHMLPISPGDALLVIDVFESKAVSPQLNVDRVDFPLVRTANNSSCLAYREFSGPFTTEVSDLRAVLGTANVLQVGVAGVSSAVLAEIVDTLRTQAPDVRSFLVRELNWKGGGDSTLMIASAAATKWNGILAYCQNQSIDPNRVVAIGDDINDIEMLSNAAVGFAMPHAPSEVKEVCKAVLPVNPGWAGVLDYLDTGKELG
jgi:5-amino-6-(5-phospho-D-ribitylamino)uracil phosphatase